MKKLRLLLLTGVLSCLMSNPAFAWTRKNLDWQTVPANVSTNTSSYASNLRQVGFTGGEKYVTVHSLENVTGCDFKAVNSGDSDGDGSYNEYYGGIYAPCGNWFYRDGRHTGSRHDCRYHQTIPGYLSNASCGYWYNYSRYKITGALNGQTMSFYYYGNSHGYTVFYNIAVAHSSNGSWCGRIGGERLCA